MKYIQAIWHFLSRIPTAIKTTLRRTSNTPHPTSDLALRPHSHHHPSPHPPVSRKKSKTFRSFIRNDSRSSRQRQKSLSRARFKPGRRSLHPHLKNGKLKLSASSMDEHSEDLFTNEIQPECSAVFEDDNGLQISAIASIHPQQQQNVLEDSEDQLLQLIYGTRSGASKEKGQSKGRRESSRRDFGKTWWQVEIDKGRKEFHRNMSPSAEALQLGERHLKIIAILDLSQDPPKLHQMPLSLHYS